MISQMLQFQFEAARASLRAASEQIQALEETLKLAEAACQKEFEVVKPGCPKCGSPKRVEMPSLGGLIEYQCLDCRNVYGPTD